MTSYILLGIATGMRTMTAICVLCWYAWLQYLPQHGWGFWAGNLISAIVFTVFALGEYFGDTLPATPSRRNLPLVLGRVCFGALVGALATNALSDPLAAGILFGVVGALIGTYGGWWLRMVLATLAKRDLPVAIGESCLALGMALFAAHGLATAYAKEMARFHLLHMM